MGTMRPRFASLLGFTLFFSLLQPSYAGMSHSFLNAMSNYEKDSLKQQLIGRKLTHIISNKLKLQDTAFYFRDLNPSLRTLLYFPRQRLSYDLEFSLVKDGKILFVSCPVDGTFYGKVVALSGNCEVKDPFNGKVLSEKACRERGLEIKDVQLNFDSIDRQVEALADSPKLSQNRSKRQAEALRLLSISDREDSGSNTRSLK
jgi:hypothetical protein